MATVLNATPDYAKPVFPIVETGNGEFTHQVPEAIHSGFIRGEGSASEQSKRALKFVAQELTALNVSRVKMEPDHQSKVTHGFNEIGNALTEARTGLQKEEKTLRHNLAEKANFKPDASLTAIVVGTFQAMRPEERAGAVAKLIEQGDGPTLAILASVSNVFTGLMDELKATIEPRLFKKADPAAYAELENARFNLGRIEGASIASANACAVFSAPMHKAANAPKAVHKSVMD